MLYLQLYPASNQVHLSIESSAKKNRNSYHGSPARTLGRLCPLGRSIREGNRECTLLRMKINLHLVINEELEKGLSPDRIT